MLENKHLPSIRLTHLAWIACALLAASCASAPRTTPETDTGAVSTAVERTSTGFEDAALAPLSDLNLRREPIPQRLLDIQSPYAPAPVLHCEAISQEVAELTAILGPDIDASDTDDTDPTLRQRAGEEAGDLALDTIESTTTGFIPFRGLVRQATGATAHDKKVRRAYERGIQRRAFLKGAGFAAGCSYPAAPNPWTPTQPMIDYRKASPD